MITHVTIPDDHPDKNPEDHPGETPDDNPDDHLNGNAVVLLRKSCAFDNIDQN
jgi:hypothetical protein